MVTEATKRSGDEQSDHSSDAGILNRLRFLNKFDEGITEFLVTRPMVVVLAVAVAAAYVLASHMKLTEATLGPALVVPVGDYYMPLTAMTAATVAILAFVVGRLAATVDTARLRAVEAQEAAAAMTAALEERNKAERRLHEAHTRLEASHATIDDWANELEETNARLHKLDATKTNFISDVSHEIRGPLAAMVSAAKIIRKHHESKPEVVGRFSGTIISEGDRLARLINDFLDLSRLETGCIDWKLEEIHASDLVNAALLNVEPLALERGVLISSTLEEGMPAMRVDGERITQALTNLLGNAIARTPESGSVSVTVERADKKFVFAVADTGSGLPADDRDRLFTDYKQGSAAGAGGTVSSSGLGLCIAKAIVELYGGKIWVSAQSTEGSVFRFTIPDEGAATLHKNADVVSVMSTRTQSIRVAFLCDDRRLADRALAMPMSSGVDCQSRPNVGEMDELLRSWTPDCLLVTRDFFDGCDKPVLQCAQDNGMVEVLIYEHGGEISARSVKASSEVAVRRLHYYCSWGSRVLLVEDDEEYRNIVRFELEHQGYQVLLAGDGQEALDIIREERPDGIILDVVIPRIDGLTILEYLSENELNIPTIVLTGVADPTVVAAAQKLGASEVVHKGGGKDVARAAVVARLQRVLTPVLENRQVPAHQNQDSASEPAAGA